MRMRLACTVLALCLVALVTGKITDKATAIELFERVAIQKQSISKLYSYD